jgi:hypothetical protein
MINDLPQTSTPEQSAEVMTGADLLRRAADRLADLTMHITMNPWRARRIMDPAEVRIEAVCPNGETWTIGHTVSEGDAAWIVATGGLLGAEALMALLANLSGEAEEIGANHYAVALARIILGEET